MTEYQTINGISYHKDTPQELIKILEHIRQNRIRVKFYFGDSNTGRDWGEVNDIKGTIGNSTGTSKIPLLVYSRRSYGGPALSDNCIVKIELTIKPYTVLYQHPKYHKESTG